jgi:hypothetical protein
MKSKLAGVQVAQASGTPAIRPHAIAVKEIQLRLILLRVVTAIRTPFTYEDVDRLADGSRQTATRWFCSIPTMLPDHQYCRRTWRTAAPS